MNHESLINKRVKGLRVRLRNELKRLGIKNKFRTSHTRNNSLIVECNPIQPLLKEFEGYEIIYLKR